MKYMPIIVAVFIYGIAYGLYTYLPGAYDDERSIFWIFGSFFVLYIIAAVYVSYSASPF
ncbi:MAG: hypothetical protein NUV81_00915 [bacterium]|nr:hypothetical protein [bacterium]